MPERIYQVSAAHREKVIGKVEDCLLVFHKGSTSTWQLKNGNCIHMHFISCLETRIDTLGARWEKGEKVGEGECKTKGEWMQKELWSIKSCYILYSSHLCISMKPSCEKLHFWGTSDAFLMPGCVILLGINWGKEAKGNKKKKEGGGGQKKAKAVTSHPTVPWATRMREVMMRPYCEKSCSSSFWVMVFGKPLTYKFASLMEAELGRA